MIFATVGTQLTFQRLIQYLRDVVEQHPHQILAQTIDQEYEYCPKGRLVCVKNLTPQDFDRHMSAATLVVSHAGIGSIISASRFQKPIILVPRRCELGEHRNDHQVDTTHRFAGSRGIYVANDGAEIADLFLADLEARPLLDPASSSLISGISRFIADD